MTKDKAKELENTIRKTKKSGKIGIVIALLALVFTIIAAISVLYMNGIFMSKSDRILYCLNNTFVQPTPFTKSLDFKDVFTDEFTVDINSQLKAAEMDAQLVRAKGQIQLSGMLDYNDVSFDLDLGINDKDVSLYVPKFFNKTLVYRYTEKNSGGALLGFFDDSTIEKYNESIKNIYDKSQIFGGVGEISQYYKYLHLWWATRPIEKAANKEYTMFNQTKNCKGYTVSLTKSETNELLSLIEKELMTGGSDERMAIAGAYDSLSTLLKEMGNIKVTFYLYDNKYVSGIIIRSDNANYELVVKGGSKPWMNSELFKDGNSYLAITGSMKGTEENYVVMKDGKMKYEIRYDSAADVVKVTTDKGTQYDLNWVNLGDTLQLTLNNVAIKGKSHEGQAVLTVTKGAKIKPVSAESIDVSKVGILDLVGLFFNLGKLRSTDDKTADTNGISICMVGDILTHMRLQNTCKRADGTYDYSAVFSQTKDFISARDVAIVNQEVILGGTELGITGYPEFNSPYELADDLVETGFDIICHATNHALDRSSKGLLNCLNNWRDKYPQINVLGIHDSQADQDNLTILDIKGHKIAFLNYTYGTNGIPLPSKMPYAVDLLDEKKVVAQIKEAESKAEFTVLMPHWGSEYLLTEDYNQKKWAKIFLENGVDLVIGTHPHVIEPVEMMTDDKGHQMLVYYSIGNFVNWSGSEGAGVCNRMVGGIADVMLMPTEKGLYIADAKFVPIVTDLHSKQDGVVVYFLKDYTAEQAMNNQVRNSDSTFTLDYATNLVKKVVDEKYLAW